jgi:small-conductance mechanosensitive channel
VHQQQQQQQSVGATGSGESGSSAAAAANGEPGSAIEQPNALELSAALNTLCKSVQQVLSSGVQAAEHEQRAAQALADLAECTRTLQSRLSSSSSSSVATAPGTPITPFVQLTNGSGAHTVSLLLYCKPRHSSASCYVAYASVAN